MVKTYLVLIKILDLKESIAYFSKNIYIYTLNIIRLNPIVLA
ncbi:MAG: hypothetical protein R6V14_07260 [Halanaerobiales bacterium]